MAFVDILGFSELVERSYGDAASITPAEIKEALDVPPPAGPDKIVLGRIGDIAASNHRMTAFSDSVVISVDPTECGLMYLLHHVGEIGFRLLRLRRLCRGGVARGLIYHEGSVVFGPALLAAYCLEKHVAKFPRVILSKQVVAMGSSADFPVNKVFRSFTRQSDDGWRYVNILRVIRMIMDTESGPPPDIVEMCHGISGYIAESLSTYKEKPGLQQKYEWFKNYFDWAVDRRALDRLKQPFPAHSFTDFQQKH